MKLPLDERFFLAEPDSKKTQKDLNKILKIIEFLIFLEIFVDNYNISIG